MPLTTVTIAGQSADLWVPEEPAVAMVVFLHGYDAQRLRDQPVLQESLSRHRLVALCPEGQGSWWLDVASPPFDGEETPVQFLATSVPDYLHATFPGLPVDLGICGFEMGGQGALQVAYRWPRVYPRVAAIGPKVDFESWYGYGTTLDSLFTDREDARQHTATLQLNPLNWPRRQLLLCDAADEYCRDGVLTLASKLSSSGVPFDSEFDITHGGYGWGYVRAVCDRAFEFLLPDSPPGSSGKS